MIVRKLRLQHGWSQDQLAQMSGLSTRTIQRIERGDTAGLESLKSLAAVFEVDVQQLQPEPVMQQSNESPSRPVPRKYANVTEEEIQAMEYVKGIKEFYSHLISFVIVNIGLIFINLFITPGFYWFFFALFGWGIGLAIHAVTAFEIFNLFGPKWEKKQIEKRLGKEF